MSLLIVAEDRVIFLGSAGHLAQLRSSWAGSSGFRVAGSLEFLELECLQIGEAGIGEVFRGFLAAWIGCGCPAPCAGGGVGIPIAAPWFYN